jgi:hypothetical protein
MYGPKASSVNLSNAWVAPKYVFLYCGRKSKETRNTKELAKINYS